MIAENFVETPEKRDGNENLQGDEKAFAEFIEKRNEAMRAIEPLVEFARSEMVAPEARKKIFDALNFFGKTAYEKFGTVNEGRRAEIENNIITRRKAEMSPADTREAELKLELDQLRRKKGAK